MIGEQVAMRWQDVAQHQDPYRGDVYGPCYPVISVRKWM